MEHRPADARHRLGNWGYAFLMPANRYTKKLVEHICRYSNRADLKE